MNTDEKIGQLVLVGMDGTAANDATRELIESYHVGGFIFYKNNMENAKQALKLFNDLKAANQSNPVPLWMSVDEEGGRVTRMPKEFAKVPTAKAIGSKNSEALSQGIGAVLGRELSGFGLNMDFAPVLDINSNPNNPVIGDRSFGNQADVVEAGSASPRWRAFGRKASFPSSSTFPGMGTPRSTPTSDCLS